MVGDEFPVGRSNHRQSLNAADVQRVEFGGVHLGPHRPINIRGRFGQFCGKKVGGESDAMWIEPDTLAQAVAAEVGYEVEVVELYTGSLGAPGSDGDTLVRMLTTNVRRIAEALGAP